jgi:putative phosphoesterase
VTRIGLISDTHGLLRPEVHAIFAGVDRILHAGDVGGAEVLASLRTIAPVDAVFGNVDDDADPRLRESLALTLDGVTIHVSHGHELGQPTPELALSRYDAQVVVFGHTHRALVVRAPRGRMAINPGAAGPRRFKLEPSVALLTLDAGRADVDIVSIP